jgi:hypothetical protein
MARDIVLQYIHQIRATGIKSLQVIDQHENRAGASVLQRAV